MSDHYYFVCHTPGGLPRPMEDSVLKVFGPGFRVSEPSRWNFEGDTGRVEPSDETLSGRLWSVASGSTLHFTVGEAGVDRDVVVMCLTGRNLERLVEEAERDGYGLLGLLKAIFKMAGAARALWLANFGLGPAIRLARGRGLHPKAIPHVHATWGDADWRRS